MSETRRWQRIILVTGHRRGGTTWLGRMLSLAEDVAYIFEPLTHTRHPKTTHVESLRQFNRTNQHWFLSWPPSGQIETEHARVTGRQIEDLFNAYWVDPVGTLIIKQPGIEQFEFLDGVLQPAVSVYIKRHPLAILNSYLKSNLYDAWDIRQTFPLFRDDISRLRPDLSYMLSNVGSDQERQILCMCCSAHRLADDWAREGKLIVMDYEDLATRGPTGAIQLFSRFGLRMSEDRVAQLNPLFSPSTPQAGFLDTEKESKQRANAYASELAPWQLLNAKRYLEHIGYDAVVSSQDAHARISGTLEYARRESRVLTSSVRTSLSQIKKQAIRTLAGMKLLVLLCSCLFFSMPNNVADWVLYS